MNFYFTYFLSHVKESSFCFQFYFFNCNFDNFISDDKQPNEMWYCLQKNCDDEQMINYEWLNILVKV